MDFSKIKKIFYIVAIISMLLSIKSKVFAASIDSIHYNDFTFDVSENLNSHYLVCLISQDGSGNYHLEYIITEKPVTILFQTNFGYKIRYNSPMRNGSGSSGSYPNINFFNNSTIQLSNQGTGEAYLGSPYFTTDVQIFSNYELKRDYSMENAIGAFTSRVTTASFWGAFQGVVPVLAIIVVFSLAMYFARKIIRGLANKGKTKI